MNIFFAFLVFTGIFSIGILIGSELLQNFSALVVVNMLNIIFASDWTNLPQYIVSKSVFASLCIITLTYLGLFFNSMLADKNYWSLKLLYYATCTGSVIWMGSILVGLITSMLKFLRLI